MIDLKELNSKDIQEQINIIAEQQNNILKKIKRIEEIEQKFEEFHSKIKPILEKFPTAAFKDKTTFLFNKFKKNKEEDK